MDGLFLEDFTPGRVFNTPGFTVTDAAVIDFAFQYDPQPFHLDREAAKNSIFGGLCASGFQTMALSFRLFSLLGTLKNNLGGPGVDELRWLKPGLPPATRSIAASPSPSNGRRARSRIAASIKWAFETLNQKDEVVMTATFISFMKRREG